MPNLDNIFNKFFPQHQTGDKGKFLYRMAWGIEILVAIIGLFIEATAFSRFMIGLHQTFVQWT